MPYTLRIPAFLVALSAIALGLITARDANAGELPLPEEKIVYSCSFDFVLDICAMNADGTGDVMLTDDGSNDHDPEVSPGGQQIAWTKFSSEIWVMNSDGSNERRLADFGAPAFAPTWSPTGTMLAFGCWMPGSPAQGICTANADGSARELVFESLGATQPDWSPDGAFIVFQSDAGQTASDLYVLNLATSQVINVSNSIDADEYGPRWSPDGSKIAFWGEPLPNEQPGQGLFVMDANGANRRKLLAPQFFSPAESRMVARRHNPRAGLRPPPNTQQRDVHGRRGIR